MRFHAPIFVAVLSLLPLPLLADTVYDYTGNDYTVVHGSFATTMQITGSITFENPLADSLTNAQFIYELSDPDLVSFSFTDGNPGDPALTQANTTSPTIFFSTDSSGDITSWSLDIASSSSPDTIYFCSSCSNIAPGSGDTSPGDSAQDGGSSLYSYNTSPGKWTVAGGLGGGGPLNTGGVVPEPAAFMLLGTGMAGLLPFARRKLRA